MYASLCQHRNNPKTAIEFDLQSNTKSLLTQSSNSHLYNIYSKLIVKRIFVVVVFFYRPNREKELGGRHDLNIYIFLNGYITSK